MFTNQRYCICGIMDEIPEEIQTELWILIEKCRKSKKLELSYSQVFQLSKQGGNKKSSTVKSNRIIAMKSSLM